MLRERKQRCGCKKCKQTDFMLTKCLTSCGSNRFTILLSIRTKLNFLIRTANFVNAVNKKF